MTDTALFAALGDLLTFAVLVFFRVGAVVSVMPGIGTQSVPLRIKLVIALSLAAFFTTLLFVPGGAVPELTTMILVTETIIGLAIGLAFRFLIFSLHTAGTIAAQSTSLSQIFGNASVEPMPAMGHILVVGGLALIFLSGAHLTFLHAMARFYEVWPIGSRPEPGELAMWIARHVSDTFTLAFRLAVPFVILSMLYNVTLGVINKAMPQLMVSFVGAPVITLGGMGCLALAAPFMLLHWRTAVESFLVDPFGGP